MCEDTIRSLLCCVVNDSTAFEAIRAAHGVRCIPLCCPTRKRTGRPTGPTEQRHVKRGNDCT